MSVVTRSMNKGARGATSENGDKSPAMSDDVSEGEGSESENVLELKIVALKLELQIAQFNAKQAEENLRNGGNMMARSERAERPLRSSRLANSTWRSGRVTCSRRRHAQNG